MLCFRKSDKNYIIFNNHNYFPSQFFYQQLSPGWMRVFPKRGAPLYPGDAEMADYLSYLRDGYDQDPAGAGIPMPDN